MYPELKFTSITEISALYYALLQCGYEYYPIERGAEHVSAIRSFIGAEYVPAFFSGIKQTTCEVYPYWPRAAILETACFFLKPDHSGFKDFDVFQSQIMSAANIAEDERDDALWRWISDFPEVLQMILSSSGFLRYMDWEKQWIDSQTRIHKNGLKQIQRCLELCVKQYQSPVRHIQIIINPIKCVYSADYHLNHNCFIFCSGSFSAESVVHEFLHHVIHPVIVASRDCILQTDCIFPNIDSSYYLAGDDAGKRNAFEEYAVRVLTNRVLAGDYPISLEKYVHDLCEAR